MKKGWTRIFSLLLCLALCLTLLPTPAAHAAESGTYNGMTWEASDGEVTITGYTDALPANLTIPSKIDGKPVTKIGDWAFDRCSSLKNVTISTGVTSIGDFAFGDCTSLTSVSLPTSLKSIGSWAFYDCFSLTSAEIPAGVTSIGEYTFAHCRKLTSSAIPASVTDLGIVPFHGCSSISAISVASGNPNYCSVNGVLFDKNKTTLIQFPAGFSGDSYAIPSSVKTIVDFAFYACIRLKSVTIPSGLTSIGEDAFSNCLNLTSVTIPASVTNIGGGVFSSCSSLSAITVASGNPNYCSVNGVLFNKSKTTLIQVPCTFSGSYAVPSGVTEIGHYSFSGCDDLTSVTLPSSVKTLSDGSFCSCDNLTGITIPSGVTSIGNMAFAFCYSLTSVTIPAGVPSIGFFTFQNDYALKQVSFLGDAPTIDDTAFTNVTATVNYPADKSWPVSARQNYGGTLTWIAAGSSGSAPTITAQPQSVSAALGATATFSVTATNASSYQWYYQKPGESSWNAVQDNGTSATFNQKKVAARHDGYKFKCVVSNAAGSVTSSVATLTVVAAAPVITAQPKSVSAALGSTATFSVTATNASSYQWYYQKPGESTWNKAIENGTSATFNQKKVAERHDGYKFKCVVTNAVGSVTSSVATLTVASKPTITAQPKSVSAALGSTATFSVTATGATSYQWYYQKPGESSWNEVIENGPSAMFNQKKVASRHDGYKFKCVVSNAAGSTASSVATLTVASKPTITKQPQSVSAALGSTATFSVTATGATSYQWYYQKPGESAWNAVQDNGQNATFNQTRVASRHDGYKFKCVVSNAAGSVTSSAATLTVATADSGTYSGMTWEASNGKVAITGHTDALNANLTIPATIEGMPVTSIGDEAFQECEALTSVTIPNSVTSIGACAFVRCHGLASVTIPEGVASIGNWAFQKCDSLASVTIPASVTSIGQGAFSWCPSLSAINVASGNTAFVVIGGVLFTKNRETLLCCPAGKSGSYAIPSGVKSIESYSFEGCSQLSGITIPSSVTSIGEWAFEFCSALTGVTIPSSVTSIGEGAFIGCSALTGVTISSSVTTIRQYTFCDCAGLKTISIPASVTSIEANAFGYDPALNQIEFLGSAPTIDEAAFTSVTATVNYPADKNWPTSARQNYGGTLTWVAAGSSAAAPTITSQPANVTADLGVNATFSVTATGSDLSYQWFYQKPGESTWNAVQDNGQSATFTQKNVAARHNGYRFNCYVSNSLGYAFSDAATLSVSGVAPVITSQPFSTNAELGTTATFRVSAAGDNMSYQWYYQKPGESNWNQVIDNGQSAVFNQTKVALRHDGYKFKCVVSNAWGSVTSSVATLTVY